MNIPKLRFFLLGASVISPGIVLGSLLWLKLAPPVVYRDAKENAGEGFGSVPDFSLVERSGQKTSLADLRGKIWVADFIYTNCADTCPLQTAEMAKLQESWMNENDIKLVSFSVDPERDTPRVLAQYAERFDAAASRWLFLTGEKAQIVRLVQGGFRLAAAPAPGGAGEKNAIIHSPRFVLIDRKATIRGYYDSREPQALQRLKNDVASLLNQKKE